MSKATLQCDACKLTVNKTMKTENVMSPVRFCGKETISVQIIMLNVVKWTRYENKINGTKA